MTVQARSYEQQIGFVKEAVYGTGVNPTAGHPVTEFTGSPQISLTMDQGRRGVGSRDFDAIPDAGHGEFTMDGFAYPVSIGDLLMGIMGTLNTVGTMDPWVHTFTRGDTPQSYTVEETLMAGATNGLRYVGARIGQLAFSYEAASGVLGYSSTWMSRIPATITPQTIVTTPSDAPWPGWRGTVASTDLATKVTAMDLTITRELEVVHVGDDDQQSKYINPGPVGVEGTVTVVAEDMSAFDAYLANARQPLVLTFDDVTNERSIIFTMTDCDLGQSPIETDRGAVSVTHRLGFVGIHNTTDGGPISIALENGVDGVAY